MGTVWRAYDERLGRAVAVKTLRETATGVSRGEKEDADAAGRLGREARAAAALASPHIVPVYDFGVSQDTQGRAFPYLVMELVSGQTLTDVLHEHGRLPLSMAVGIARDVVDALVDAHRAGVVHRDIKPSNVMITKRGRAKVMDFGIATFLGPVTGNEVTRTGGCSASPGCTTSPSPDRPPSRSSGPPCPRPLREHLWDSP